MHVLLAFSLTLMVFHLSCRDNVEWSTEQEEAAQKKVQENSQPLPAEKQGIKHFVYHLSMFIMPYNTNKI